MSWRHESVSAMPRIQVPVDRAFISRLPLISSEDPTPLPMAEVILLIPGYDPHAGAEEFQFDEARALRAINFFHVMLTHTKGEWAGRPLLLELWEQAIIANIFGWVDDAGNRRYREAFVFLPRKNGKTLLASGIVLYGLFCDDEPGAEVYSAAADKDQASLVWQNVRGMVEEEPEFGERCRIYPSNKSLQVHESMSFYRALTKTPDSKHGFNTHVYVMDELHAQRSRDLLDVLETSTKSRRQPLGVVITTADFDGPSICNEKENYAEGVCSGTVDDVRFLPVLYRSSPGDDWELEKTWREANPNYGVSIKPESMERDHQKALNSPEYQNTFKRLSLNMRTQQLIALFDMPQFDACGRKYTPDSLAGEECYGGLDLASTRDLTAFVLWFPRKERMLSWFWMPGDGATKRDKRDRTMYAAWANDGYITLTDGDVCDYERVERDILAASAKFDVKSIAFDRWGAQDLVNRLTAQKVEMTAFGQGYASMSMPTKEFDRLIGKKAAGHAKNPVMRWCIKNTVGKHDPAGNVKPDKDKSREKIDGAVAWIMAIGEAISMGANKKPDPYKKRGFRTL